MRWAEVGGKKPKIESFGAVKATGQRSDSRLQRPGSDLAESGAFWDRLVCSHLLSFLEGL